MKTSRLWVPALVAALVLPDAPAADAGPFGVPQLQVAGSSLGSAPVLHDGAPLPVPFTPDYLVGYVSDVSSHGLITYYDVTSQFASLRGNEELMARNLEFTLAANNSATPELIARAQQDSAADSEGLLFAFSDALGDELGGAMREALAENRLPKTEFLLGNGYSARAGGLASSLVFDKMLHGYPRPFEVAPGSVVRHDLPGYQFYEAAGESRSFPSGHANQAVWVSTLLGLMLPELGPQILARGADSGYHRVVMGVHFPLDVVGGRMTGTAAAADRWNDPKMRDALQQAAAELRAELEWRTGRPVAELVPAQSAEAAVEQYTGYMTFGLPPVGEAGVPMIVPPAAPDLLLSHHPGLTYGQRAEVLRQTALRSGHALDHPGPAGSWQRLNLAAAWAAEVSVAPDGTVSVES
ncbi:phosphatase PAP2 family protein [Corynebacterium comes]|uniref:PAP2 superfamily protein n=1 Tax=Corynebacterium comes TaxID=2675218 RepID=A0A6B8VUW9_9CORY|nr:phosphatase PAP2 family protein [Corynebacterium comes]QGU05134.1 PAP2 superfamily protein [Corynebacterium comes]